MGNRPRTWRLREELMSALTSQRVRLWFAMPLMILGGLITLLGSWSIVYARLTGHLDPYHGGRMLFDAGVSTLAIGVVFLGIAFFLWPRR
jgi:hypothetical protein